jgi:hypothetical protein
VYVSGTASTEQFFLPDVPLPYARRRDAELTDVASCRGWPILGIGHGKGTTSEQDRKSDAIFAGGGILLDPYSGMPFATVFQRLPSGLGVAWLPGPLFDAGLWTEAIVAEWAKSDTARLPGFSDWTMSPQWLVPEELAIREEIARIEIVKAGAIKVYDSSLGDLSSKLTAASQQANLSRRRLISAQGDDLVREVSAVLTDLGFIVTVLDDLLPEGATKREDLRLRLADDIDPSWEAIAEVRGYTRSAGTTADLARLARFASIYASEMGKPPSKRYYIVNGQIELAPSIRQAPLVSAPEDTEEYAKLEGLIVSTLDLFQAWRRASIQGGAQHIRASLIQSSGLWSPPS